MARLKIESGGGRREIALSGIITIGRQNESSIHIDDPKTSRFHARLYHDGKYWVLEDLESRSGTILNGEKISSPATLSRLLLESVHLSVVQGDPFGSLEHIRISYATSMDRLEEGLNRLDGFVQDLK